MAWFLVLAAVGELTFRLPVVRSRLDAPGLGSASRQFELQLARLEDFEARFGKVDCIVIGNSLALLGLDPATFASTYERYSRRRLRCFDFAVQGLSGSSAGAVARVLSEDYHPWLLIYALSARDLSPVADGPALSDSAWISYRLGRPSLAGWLIEWSRTYRYALHYKDVVTAKRVTTDDDLVRADGFQPSEAQLQGSVHLLATRDALTNVLRGEPSTSQLNGLADFVSLAQAGQQVAIVEMPVHSSLRRWMKTTQLYERAIFAARSVARRHGVPFWRKRSWARIPDGSWHDGVHLNRHGAAQFSAWLAGMVATNVKNGNLPAPAAPPA